MAALTGVLGPAIPAHANDTEALLPLVDAAAQRLQTAEPVAATKWQTKTPIEDPVRVDQVLSTVTSEAAAKGADAERVRRIFTDQIHATEAIEYARFAQWKLDPGAAPVAAPDLASSRAVIDGLNHRMVDEIARQRHVLESDGCADHVTAATEAVASAHDFDPLYRQALSFVTRSYCAM